MNFRVWIKTRLADKALAPLREELVALFDDDASLLEIGCGTGDLLFKAHHKIRSGYGVDLDAAMIQHANQRLLLEGASNLHFAHLDARELAPQRYDIATSTLCLHEMERQAACNLLQIMRQRASKIFIADYFLPKKLISRIGIEFDELISGHYRRFRAYRNAGYMPAYFEACGLTISHIHLSCIDGILIWELSPGHIGQG